MKLILNNLTKEFPGVRAVDHISVTMQNGVYGLLGVNGAGKTTLMRMLCTLAPPTSGNITYNGQDIFALDQEYRKILGYLPQDFGFYPDFTITDYLMYISSIKGLLPALAKKRTRQLLHEVGLWEVRNQKMKKLSGGMKRRAGIAQAMLNDPQILILDEPTAGLDPAERIRFRNLISSLAGNRLILLSTHIVSDVEYIADEILLMKDGQFLHTGTLAEIIGEVDQHVYNCPVPQGDVNHYLTHYKVANIRSDGTTAWLRILAQKPPCTMAQEDALCLEDVFLYYFGAEESADGHVSCRAPGQAFDFGETKKTGGSGHGTF